VHTSVELWSDGDEQLKLFVVVEEDDGEVGENDEHD